MTHLALRLTARSEARIITASCFTSNSEVRSMTHLALRLTARSEARIITASCFTSNSEVRSMTHLALRLTARSEARNQQRYALRLTTGSKA
jgi:hypothetical protein